MAEIGDRLTTISAVEASYMKELQTPLTRRSAMMKRIRGTLLVMLLLTVVSAESRIIVSTVPIASKLVAKQLDLFMFAENEDCAGAALGFVLKPDADRCGLVTNAVQEPRHAANDLPVVAGTFGGYLGTTWETAALLDPILDPKRSIKGQIVVGSLEGHGAGQATLELHLSVLVGKEWREVGTQEHTYDVVPDSLHKHRVNIRPDLDHQIHIQGVRLVTLSRGIAVGHGFYELAEPASYLTIPILQEPMKLTSNSFDNGGIIARKHHCQIVGGKGVSPAFAWEGPRADSFALVLRLIRPKPQKGRGVSWIVYDIPGRVHKMAEGKVPQGARTNYAYGDVGICSSTGAKWRFRFTIYALSGASPPGLPDAESQSDVEEALRCCALDDASIDGIARPATIRNPFSGRGN